MAELGLQAGPRDQRPAEGSCLTYTTEVLEDDVEVTGPVTVHLHISSTAEDTDFVAKLTDVWPGRPVNADHRWDPARALSKFQTETHSIEAGGTLIHYH